MDTARSRSDPPALTGRLPGRADQQAAIDELLTAAAAGHGAALQLVGEPGIGKSVLLGHATTAGRHAGFTTLTTAGVAAEASLPYAALHRLVRPLCQPAPALPAAQLTALSELLGGGPAPLGTGELVRCTALLTLLDTATRDRPLLCCVDDLDRLDAASQDVLGLVARRLAGTRIALIATAPNPSLAGVPTTRLPPLPAAAGRALLADQTRGVRPAGAPLPEPLVRHLLQLAGGIPQALCDLAGALSPAQLAGDAPGPASLPPESHLRRTYQQRVGQLPADTQWLLLLIAAERRLPVRCLVAAAARSGVDIAALAPAERAGLIQTSGEVVRFVRPLVRTLVAEAAPLPQRGSALVCVGEAAATTGDHRRAASALARAANLTGQPAEAARRQVLAARYAWLGGHPGRARRLLHRARSGATGKVAAELRLLHSEIELRAGEPANALATLLPAATVLAEHRRDLALRALLWAVEAAWFTGAQQPYAEIADQLRALRPTETGASETGAVAEQQMLAYLAGFTETFQGRPQAAVGALRQVVSLAEQLPEPAGLTLAAWAGLLLADYPTVQRLATRAVATGQDRGDVAALPLAFELLARARFALGDFDAAEVGCRDGLRAAHASGQPGYAADHLALRAVLAAVRGDAPGCRHWLGQLALPRGAGPSSRPAALAQWALAVLELGAGQPGAAADRLAAVGDPGSGRGQVTVQLMAAHWLVEAAVTGGRQRQRARSVLAVFSRWAGATVGHLPSALAARSRALMAPPGSPAAVSHFAEARRLHQLDGGEFEQARCELLYGQALRRLRRPREARAHLHQAWEIFARLSLPSWAQRAGSELRAAGEPVTVHSTNHPVPAADAFAHPATDPEPALTAQQRRIAELVARGATNREVAAQLFLSPRTVDHHLRNIFHRLGIRSRVELARRFG
ncbi:AAA family ATPase [Natronosporangium hydrolyticum]|uniref:AAA family ATPase n=1 Tax=Natronosporangium hydrolyticum TaxID=2811111 RepID=A0A895Y6S3_9ACTN|nr:LuxR family transcriptional regulator [Natronosporangium hydrolyticum]QSB13071.1 AAA family ATPase [Natronosporangium hydrolyticum]